MREFDQNIDLDYDATLRFFRRRGEKMDTVGALSAVLYQDREPELARQRSQHEFDRIVPKLTGAGAEAVKRARILDLGCGTGRWMQALEAQVQAYVGLDFCEDFLAEARRAADALPDHGRFRFDLADLSKGLPATVAAQRYDVIIISGVLIYLNDADVRSLLGQLAGLMSTGALLYVREPLGVDRRLTLKDHFSADLDASYSSVYRSLAEFRGMLAEVARTGALDLQESTALYPDTLERRADTRQYYFLLRKPGV